MAEVFRYVGPNAVEAEICQAAKDSRSFGGHLPSDEVARIKVSEQLDAAIAAMRDAVQYPSQPRMRQHQPALSSIPQAA